MGFVDNLRALMTIYNLSGESIARIAGVTPGAVSQWRSRKTSPREDAVNRLCEYFDLERDQLMSDHYGLAINTYNIKADRSTTQVIKSERELHLLLIYRSLNDDGRAQLYNFADILSATSRYERKSVDRHDDE